MAKKALKEVRFAKVGDIMTKKVAYIDGKVTVAGAIRQMREQGVSSLVVNRRAVEDAWGVMTVKDVVSKVVGPGKDPRKVHVFEIMTKPIIMVSPGLAVKYCARLFSQAGVRRAPVFDGKDIVGIVSVTDIFKAIKL
jgi:CBS domain-containing protein